MHPIALSSPIQGAARRALITVARFALDGPVLPLVIDTLPVAEAVRAAVMGIYQRRLHLAKYGTADPPYQERFYSELLAGKDAAAQPLHGHGHAYFLPTDEDRDGRIDHLTVVAGHGFAPDDVRALERLRSVRVGDGDPLRLLLIGLGNAHDFRSPLFETSAVWLSATPFVVTRYPKHRGTKRDRPEDCATPQVFAAHVLGQEIARLRERRPELPPCAVEVEEVIGPRRLRTIQFHRFRRKANDDGGRRPAGAFRLRFADVVAGPLSLGHAAHFGLGLFLPEEGNPD